MILFFLPVSCLAINAPGPIDNAADLIKSGNIHELSRMFAPTVELTILNDEDIYSATQAELVLANFFKSNPVKSVSIFHRVNSNPNFRFAVLIVATSSGTYRTSISLKQIDGQFLLNEIRIETEKKI